MEKSRLDIELLDAVRKYRGMTLAELGKAAKLTAGALSMLKGVGGSLVVTEEREEAISSALRMPSEILRLSWLAPSAEMQFRKRATTPQKLMNRLVARLQLMTSLLDKVPSSGTVLPAESLKSPESAAKAVRKSLRLGDGPVKNVMMVAESLGLVLVPIDSGCPKFDAVMQLDSLKNGIVFYERGMPVDRLRATIAHEIGHYVLLHWGEPSEENENAAWAFAGEFLIPSDNSEELYGLKVRSALQLKAKWGVSMAFVINRAKALGVINADQSTALWKQMSISGFRTVEPQFPKLWPEEKPALSLGLIRSEASRNKLFSSDAAKELFAEVLMGDITI